MKKKIGFLLQQGCVLLATGVLAACGSSKSSNAEATKSMVMYTPADPETLDLPYLWCKAQKSCH